MTTANSVRFAALKEFDESKGGVKGLVDSGITSLPPIFRSPDPTTPLSSACSSNPRVSIPTIDLSVPRHVAVDLVRSASKTLGFFQVTNHGIPLEVISGAISAVRSFNELPLAARSPYYSRDLHRSSSYFSNYDLFFSPTATWRDTLQVQWGPRTPDTSQIPVICREELTEFDKQITQAGKLIMGIMAEGLGLETERLERMTCHEGRQMLTHYYPWCPEPDQAVGSPAHTDPSVVTLLVQDSLGGLQVKWDGPDGESDWLDVKPTEGAIVVNVADLFQIISNDEYKSVHHRVMANSHKEARVSIAVFFTPGKRGESDMYGPLPELVSPEKPAAYRNFTLAEFFGALFKKSTDISLKDNFKLSK